MVPQGISATFVLPVRCDQGGLGVASVEELPTTPVGPTVTVAEIRKGVFELSNGQYKLEIENGSIISLVDLSNNRQILANGGKANQFVLFDDKPLYRQAWDVEVYHLNTRKELPGGISAIAEQGTVQSKHCHQDNHQRTELAEIDH